jgi:3-phosphoshikimate 1-carboxyvinyltransferase
MAFSIASLIASEEICINECANVNTSFPGFVKLAGQAGIRIKTNAG